jgi:signal transduction histidine kinase
LRRIPIRTKLAAALAVPLIALAVTTVLEVANTSRTVGRVREQTELARSVVGPAGLITTLQNERTWALVELVGFDEALTVQEVGYQATRAETDAAIEDMQADIDARGGSVADALQPALDELGALEAIRSDIDASTHPRDLTNIDFTRSVFDRYTDLVRPMFVATTRLSFEVDDPQLRQGTRLADTVARQIETMSQMMILTIANALISPGGVDQPVEISEIARLHADFQRQSDLMQGATGEYGAIADEMYPVELAESASTSVDQALATGRIDDLDSVLASMNVPHEEGYVGYQSAVHQAVEDRADHLNAQAESQRLWFAGLALVAVTAAAILTWLVSRSITRPLRSLTVQAKDMAEHRLPEAVLGILERPLGDDVEVPPVVPVDVRTRDEVADVAEALNTVQDSALELAVEQAVLRRNIADSFVNLGRRNQNLLGRQLDFITELEADETDPDTLGALFRLDHLATRMRRNAESLLVLAGIDPPRKWAAPVRLTDVIRSALGEVESYQRVALRGVEPATVVGAVAADLSHLVAELVENALTFSSPDRSVDIRGALRADGGYSLAVIDAGFGMPAADLEQANRRLAGAESFTVAPSKYLGHYVAGNLAARHGIDLRLDNTPGSGVTASIELPTTLLTTAAPQGGPATDPRGTRAARAARALAPVGGGGAPVHVAAAAQVVPVSRPLDVRPPAALGQPAVAPALPAGPVGPGGVGAPAGPVPAEPQVPAASAEPAQTAHGLVKRTPRRETPPAHRVAPPVPSDELLDALRHHTGRGGDGVGQPQPQHGEAGTPPLQPLPRRHDRGAGPAQVPPRHGGAPDEGARPPLPRRRDADVGPARAAPLPSGAPGGAPMAPGPQHAAPAAGPGHEGQGPTTAGGLTRRVRGAQLPTSQPLSLRRGTGQPPTDRPSPAPGGAGATPGGAGGDGPAQDVYGFLSNFSSGVQRGLDETRRNRGA